MSDDLGASWRKIYPDSTNRFSIVKTNSSNIFTCEFFPHNYVGIYYIEEGSIFCSSDFGNSWQRTTDTTEISAFAFEVDKIYAGGNEIKGLTIPPRFVKTTLYNNIIISTDNGISWTKVQSPLDSEQKITFKWSDTCSLISCLYAKGSHLLAGMRAYYFYEKPYAAPTAYGGGLVHLNQDNEQWNIADSSFIGRSVFAFESKGNDIYAATDTGVYRSTDLGSNWSDISSGMKNIYVSSLFKSDTYLYANTINGLWKRSLSEITAVDEPRGNEIPQEYSLSQNYPNPFNPTTNFEFRIADPPAGETGFGLVTLKIFDLLGREVAVLVNEEKPAGAYQIKFDAGNLASGVYFYQLKAGIFISTKKMLLLK
jgi:hypothetical protein